MCNFFCDHAIRIWMRAKCELFMKFELWWVRVFSEMGQNSSDRKMELPWSWWSNWSPTIDVMDWYSVWLSWLEWPFSSVLLWISTPKLLKDFFQSFWPFLPKAIFGLRVWSLPVSVCPSIHLSVCMINNSWPIQVRITKFGTKVAKHLG